MMSVYMLAVAIALAVMAIPYVQRAKHPQTRPLAAYLLFVSVFAVTAAGLSLAITLIADAAGVAESLFGNPAGFSALLAAVSIAAFFAARWQLKRPPRGRPLPP